MARMLDALRRLEAASRLTSAKAPVVAAREAAPSNPSPTPSTTAVVEIAPPISVPAVTSRRTMEIDEPPLEPTFGSLVSWDDRDEGFNYASHAFNEALDVLDSLASEAAESAAPVRWAAQPMPASENHQEDSPALAEMVPAIVEQLAESTIAEESATATSMLDEFDPALLVSDHVETEPPDDATLLVGLGDAPAVAADVESTMQFAEHWATIALEEFVASPPPAPEYPRPVDDYALPTEPAVAPPPEVDAQMAENSLDEANLREEVAVAPLRKEERNRPTPETSSRPAHSPAEMAAMLDLNDTVLSAQYTQLGERIASELTTTTKTCAALVSVEHQPHVSDVTLRTAMALCRRGRQVLVIDAALGDKHLTNGLAMPVEFGLSEVLKGRVPWQQAVRATATPGLCVLPAGRLTPPRLADDDHRLKDVLKELTSQWDLVLLDGGSLAESSARYVAAAARNVYLVVRLGETDAAATEAAAQSLRTPEVVLRGCIVTNAT